MKKVLSAILVIMTLCVLVTPASAATIDPIDPQYDHISSIYALIHIDESSGLATCGGEVNAKMMTPVKVVVQLQQYKDGKWKTLETWSNTGMCFAEETGFLYVLKGYTYRTKVTGFIYDENENIIESASGTDQQYY